MPYAQEDAERFVQCYNRLDKYMRMITQASASTPHSELLDRIRKYDLDRIVGDPENNEFLKDMARLRNTIIHNPTQDGEVIALPLRSVVDRYARLLELATSPPLCTALAHPLERIVFARRTDRIWEAARRMRQAQYSHLPILEDGRVTGVFSESSLYTWFSLKSALTVTQDSTIADLGHVIDLDAHSSEFYGFLPENADMDDLLERFFTLKQGRKRLAMVFITRDGSPQGKLVGLLTAWDVLRYTVEDDTVK
ncbi:MAG: CBS domain-containing protein [Eubacteriales bacterium]|nr:CBS domain-containing protein [Eubacteriales bacterium]